MDSERISYHVLRIAYHVSLCSRSLIAVYAMDKLGLTGARVSVMEGGIAAFARDGYELEVPAEAN